MNERKWFANKCKYLTKEQTFYEQMHILQTQMVCDLFYEETCFAKYYDYILSGIEWQIAYRKYFWGNISHNKELSWQA